MNGPSESLPSHGVQALIDRLRQQGVEAGQCEAEKILAEARTEAESIVASARGEAENLMNQARSERIALEHAAREALAQAVRDAQLELRERLTRSFSQKLHQLVSQAMAPQSFLERLVLQLAGRVRQEVGLDEAGQVTVELPLRPLSVEELRKRPESPEAGTLSQLALGVAAEMLREGVRFEVAKGSGAGIRLHLEAQGIVVDLSDEAVSDALLAHLRPRFQTLIEGLVIHDPT